MTEPVQGVGKLNPATNAALEKLKAQIDSNKTGLKGSELINFQQFAKASGISDEDIQAFFEANGLAVAKDEKTIRKEDIAEFKADGNRENSSRGVKENIIEQRQGYMQVALDAFKNAQSPEEKAQIMNLVQSMPRTADSRSEYDGKMQTWLARLENVIGSEKLQQSMAAFSQKTEQNFNATRQDIQDGVIATSLQIDAARDEIANVVVAAKDAVNDHTTNVGAQTTKDVNRHTSRVGNKIVRTVQSEAAATREHVTAEHETTRLHVTAEHEATRDQVIRTGTDVSQVVNEYTFKALFSKNGAVEQINNRQDQNASILSAQQEVTRMLKETNLNDFDVQALGNEATRVVQDSRLGYGAKMMLLQSMADKINDVSYISDKDLEKIRHAHELYAHGVNVPILDRDLNGEIRQYVDYDNLPELPAK